MVTSVTTILGNVCYYGGQNEALANRVEKKCREYARDQRREVAGYNVLTYDLRKFGQSGAGNGGIFTVGRFESRDVIGSLNYVRSRHDTRDMMIGLFSRCVAAMPPCSR